MTSYKISLKNILNENNKIFQSRENITSDDNGPKTYDEIYNEYVKKLMANYIHLIKKVFKYQINIS